MNLDGVFKKLNTRGWNVKRTASDSLKKSIQAYKRLFSFSRFFSLFVRLPFIVPLPGITCRVIKQSGLQISRHRVSRGE